LTTAARVDDGEIEDQHGHGDVDVDVDDEVDVCSLCRDDVVAVSDEDDPVAVCLHECCKAKHHHSCLDTLVEWSMQKGVVEVYCPICRQPLVRGVT